MNDNNLTVNEDKLRGGLSSVTQALDELIGGNVTLSVLESALQGHDDLLEQLSLLNASNSSLEALSHIERFIIDQALDIYSSANSDSQKDQIIECFAHHLLAVEGIGPATAKHLFEAGIAYPDDVFDLTTTDIENLSLPTASKARILALHEHYHSQGD
ncbi:helix-hairpin-helix domain-containing protein [Vreelandella zhaodongensis]|uniref:helix-hairpin-helix domain-containing protein n=1 Tax=Vreelandella zhaodongensis TaxID=1176240 RepID=UPI003EBC1905